MRGERASKVQTLATRLAVLFENAGIDYAIGGALCFGAWAPPRGTIDVDITAFVEEKDYSALVGLLSGVGCEFETEEALKRLRERGVCHITLENYRIDVYVPDIPLYSAARRRRKKVRLGGRQVWVWAPEDIILFKMMYFREKDRVDVLKLIAVQRRLLDLDAVRNELVDAVGEHDERVRWWDSAVAKEKGK